MNQQKRAARAKRRAKLAKRQKIEKARSRMNETALSTERELGRKEGS